MKQSLFIFIFLIFNIIGYSQNKEKETNQTMYMTIKSYKEMYNKPLTKSDSLTFKVIHGDTMVQVKNYIKPKGISVPYEYKDATFLKYYEKVAFNHKNGEVNDETPMRYWKDDIKIFFSKSVSKKVKSELMSFANDISSQVDSLNIYEVKKVEDSNYIIYYFGDYNYESKMMNYKKSNFYMYWNGNNQIYKNAVKIDEKLYFNDVLRLYEIKKYFFQTLGYFRFIDDFDCESYFSNCYSPDKKLTTLDLELLKYHYSYGICKGTDLQTFQEQHKRAKEALEKNGTKIMFLHTY